MRRRIPKPRARRAKRKNVPTKRFDLETDELDQSMSIAGFSWLGQFD